VYRRTFSVPLLFDDLDSIANNLSIRSLWPIWPVLAPPPGAGVQGRPLLNLSYALNYAGGGVSVFGYHLANLLIHLLAGWTLFLLVRRTLRQPALAGRFAGSANPLALAISAIWTWHPVQTESVTYLSQRAESLMGLLYLLTLYCFVRGAQAADRRRLRLWWTFSFLACLAGVATKEVIVTAPLVALLYDRTFLTGSFNAAWRRHRAVYLALAATWIPLGCSLLGQPRPGFGFSKGFPWWAYGLTECRVVVQYLRLSFWPRPLIFDYGLLTAESFSQVWPYAAALAALLAATGVALRRSPALGFAASWFFLILAPTSSIVPVAFQPMAENRLYLPLAGVVAGTVLAAFALAGRRCLPVFALLAVGLGLAAARRNNVYSSALALWTDTVEKNPSDLRARADLGEILRQTPGRLQDAIAQDEAALRLKPDFAEGHNNLGNAWVGIPGRLDDAIAEFEEAVRLKPDFAEAHYNLANAWSAQPGRREDAVAQYQEALRLKPDFAEAHNNLGNVWFNVAGRRDAAIAEYQAALRAKPNYPEAHYNLGNAWIDLPGKLPEAIAQYEEALRLKPDYFEALNNLGEASARTPGRMNEAIAEFEETLRLKPDLAEAHCNLGKAFARTGRTSDAIRELRLAVELKPDFPEARMELQRVTTPSAR
jgi:tetratricopeptide (TPR) repeat protein